MIKIYAMTHTYSSATFCKQHSRLVKDFGQISQPDFDVSDLSNGLYIVGVWKDGNRIQTTKLSIVK